MMQKFVKMTSPEDESIVMMSAVRSFYEARGWKASDPTAEEVVLAFPEFAHVLQVESKHVEASERKQVEAAEKVEEPNKPKRAYNRKKA